MAQNKKIRVRLMEQIQKSRIILSANKETHVYLDNGDTEINVNLKREDLERVNQEVW